MAENIDDSGSES